MVYAFLTWLKSIQVFPAPAPQLQLQLQLHLSSSISSMAPKGQKAKQAAAQAAAAAAAGFQVPEGTVPDTLPDTPPPALAEEPGATIQLSQDRQMDETEAWHPPHPTPPLPIKSLVQSLGSDIAFWAFETFNFYRF